MRTVGFETAVENIDLAIQLAFREAQLERNTIASICMGLAGADREAERVPLKHWAEEQRLAKRVVVTNDALPLVYAGFADGCGVAVISGTGSVVFGRTRTGQIARCGGWGPLFGDEGSGYAIALAGLRTVARAADGRGRETTLSPRFLQAFDVPCANELIPAIYSPSVGRIQIAQYAKLVFASARDRDAEAIRILEDAAGRLAEMVATVAGRLDMTGSSIPLALTGGVFLHQESYRDLLLAALADRGLVVACVRLVKYAAAGALLLAATE